jgi:Fe-S-cluster containining protein
MAAYDYRQIGQHRVLKTKPNGECTHLSEDGCTIYDRRPSVCRTYDCRKHFNSLAGREKRRFSTSALGEAARERLATLEAQDLVD